MFLSKAENNSKASLLTLKIRLYTVILALLIGSSFSNFYAATIRVPADMPTIQSAIDSSSDGDEVIVSEGTYYENLLLMGKNITIRSNFPTTENPTASYINNTIIDGRLIDSVITLSGTETASCKITGFTITNGSAIYGGGINGNGALATLEYNNITTNTAYYGGGISNCDGFINNNKITGNGAFKAFGDYVYEGGGLYDCDGTIFYNRIYANEAYFGGGIFYSDGTIRNNIFYSNFAKIYGGALDSCNNMVLNNVIYGNSAEEKGAGAYFCNGYLISNIFWNNSAYSDVNLFYCSNPYYSCIQGWFSGGTGVINKDPLFENVSDNNFHLKDTSPCIDAGPSDSQYNDRCIPPGKKTVRNDMGAYGGLNCDWNESLEPEFYDPFTVSGYWICFQGQSTTVAPTTVAEQKNGRLICKYPTNPLPTPGFYQWLRMSKQNDPTSAVEATITYVPNSIYIMRTRISSDSNVEIPCIRVRAQDYNYLTPWTSCSLYGPDSNDVSNPNKPGTPLVTSKDFFMVWQPQAVSPGDALIAFDIYDIYADKPGRFTGELYIDEVAVYRTTVPPADSTERTITNFSTSAAGGTWGAQSNPNNAITFSAQDLKIANVQSGEWAGAGAFVTLSNPITENNLYRIKYTLKKDTADLTDQIRLRAADANNGAYTSNFVMGTGDQLGTSAKEFVHYHWTVNSRNAAFGDLSVFIDTIDRPLSGTASGITLSKIAIEKVTLPQLYIP